MCRQGFRRFGTPWIHLRTSAASDTESYQKYRMPYVLYVQHGLEVRHRVCILLLQRIDLAEIYCEAVLRRSGFREHVHGMCASRSGVSKYHAVLANLCSLLLQKSMLGSGKCARAFMYRVNVY
jgi:hypothetical protein